MNIIIFFNVIILVEQETDIFITGRISPVVARPTADREVCGSNPTQA